MLHSKSNLRARCALGLSRTLTSAAAIAAAFQQETAANNDTAEGDVITRRKTSPGRPGDRILNQPHSIDALTQKVIQEQGVNNLQNVLKSVPRKTRNAGESWPGRHQAAVAAGNPDKKMSAEIACYRAADAMSAHPATDKVSLALDGNNLINTYDYKNSYSSSPMENHIMPAAGPTFLFTANPSL